MPDTSSEEYESNNTSDDIVPHYEESTCAKILIPDNLLAYIDKCELLRDTEKLACENILIEEVSSFFGLAPLRFVSHDNGYTIALSKPMRLYSYILITVLVTCSLLNLVILVVGNKELSMNVIPRILQIIFFCKTLIACINSSVGICSAPKRMKNMLKLIEGIASVDKSVAWQYSEKTERNSRAVVSVILLMFLTVIASNFCIWASGVRKWNILFWSMAFNIVTVYMMKFIMMILELQFTVTALFVHARLRAVNKVFVTIADNALDDCPLVPSPHELVHQLARSYGTLCDAVQLVNDNYDWPLVCLIGAILGDLVVDLFFLIVDFLTSSICVEVNVFQSIWCVVNVMRILIIVEPCHNIAKEKKKTEQLVGHLMTAASPTGLLAARLQLFSKQLMLRSVSYTPLGLFTLDRTLLTAAVGAITTYLVILIQFNH